MTMRNLKLTGDCIRQNKEYDPPSTPDTLFNGSLCVLSESSKLSYKYHVSSPQAFEHTQGGPGLFFPVLTGWVLDTM